MHNEFLLVPETILSAGDTAVSDQKRQSLLLYILVQETDNGQANEFKKYNISCSNECYGKKNKLE